MPLGDTAAGSGRQHIGRRDRIYAPPRAFTALIVGILIVASTALPAGAADGAIVTAGVRAGPLSLTTGGGPTPLVLVVPGDQSTSFAYMLAGDIASSTIIDARGTGAGWALRLQATQWGGATLPDGALAVTGVVVTTVAGVRPVGGTAYPVVVPTTPESPSRSVFMAAPGTGMGTFTITPRIAIRVPAGARPPAGTIVVTLSLSAGP